MSKYIRLTKSVVDKGILIRPEELSDNIKDQNQDYYISTYYYNDDQYQQFKKTGSIKGVTNVYANKIWWDFDDEKNPEHARIDSIEVIDRLKKDNILINDIEIYFSGNKGYHVVINTKDVLTPELVANIAINKYGQNLKTLDSTLYDSAQIFRVCYTKHNKSGLFKTPITYETLKTKTTEEIKKLASDFDNLIDIPMTNHLSLNKKLLELPKKTIQVNKPSLADTVDMSKRPRHWKDYKWALCQGYFKEGERQSALMVIAATCRGLGYDKEQTYYMCKAALEKAAERNGEDKYSKEHLWNNIIETSIFGDGWTGGQYSAENNAWLAEYCKKMGFKVGSEDEKPCVPLTDIITNFKSYATNFEQNIIKTGIPLLDNNVMFLASTLNGILGQPGAGKTSFAIDFVANASKNDINSVVLSMDMGMPIIFAKLIQRNTGKTFKQVMDIFKNDPEEADRLAELIKTEYKNVGFNFRAGLTVNDIKDIIKKHEEETNKPTKLLVIDYLECLSGPYSDATANTGFISNQLKDLANELNICIILLLQTQKHSTSDISDPLLSMKQVKGSSIIEQSASVIMTLWREGYNPKTVNDDKYISFAAVKNRFGSLWTDDFSWEGTTGKIRELDGFGYEELDAFKEKKAKAKVAQAVKDKEGWV